MEELMKKCGSQAVLTVFIVDIELFYEGALYERQSAALLYMNKNCVIILKSTAGFIASGRTSLRIIN